MAATFAHAIVNNFLSTSNICDFFRSRFIWSFLTCDGLRCISVIVHAMFKSYKTIVDHTAPALCTPITPFPADPICSKRITMHWQWERKPPKLPIPLWISSPCLRRTEPLPLATRTEKLVKIARVIPEICSRTHMRWIRINTIFELYSGCLHSG